MSSFTPEELTLLKQYVSHPESDVFAIKNLPGLVGAIYARYSRAATGFKETLLKEFIKDGKMDVSHADELIDRILVAYGDDSVGELEGAHMSLEKVSAIGEKAVVDHRIGGAFIVQSTRYVYFDKKDDNGNFRYYRDPKIMASPLAQEFVATMDFCFQTYTDLLVPLQEYLKTRKPLAEAEYDINNDGVKEKFSDLKTDDDIKAFTRTYNFDLRAKSCDIVRVTLPLATHHNVGVFGNGRFYQGMISSFLTSEFSEMHDMGRKMHEGLNQIIPKYVKRAKQNDYVVATEQAMQKLADELLQNVPVKQAPEISLEPWHASVPDFDLSTTALMLYGYTHHSLVQLKEIVAGLPAEIVDKIRQTYLGNRQNRRDRPGRALEDGYPYTFDLLVTYQVFKDLERHRMSSQVWQPFTPELGYHLPEEIQELGLQEKLLVCEAKVREIYKKLVAIGLRQEAQYVVLHGHKTRWVFQANDRALMHMFELRTTPQGHPEYRKVCQGMHQKVTERSPWRGQAMKFVDYNDYYWSRADSEARQRAKERQLDEKYGHQTVS